MPTIALTVPIISFWAWPSHPVWLGVSKQCDFSGLPDRGVARWPVTLRYWRYRPACPSEIRLDRGRCRLSIFEMASSEWRVDRDSRRCSDGCCQRKSEVAASGS